MSAASWLQLPPPPPPPLPRMVAPDRIGFMSGPEGVSSLGWPAFRQRMLMTPHCCSTGIMMGIRFTMTTLKSKYDLSCRLSLSMLRRTRSAPKRMKKRLHWAASTMTSWLFLTFGQASHVYVAEFRKLPGVQTAHVPFVYEMSNPRKVPVSPDLTAVSRADPEGMV